MISKQKIQKVDKQKLKGRWVVGDKENGEWKCLYINDQLFEHYFHKDGKLNGEYKFFNFIGDLVIHRLYEENKIVKDYLK